MNSRNYFGFDHKDPAQAMDDFRSRLSDKNMWFAEMIDAISELKDKRRISEIRIREGQPVEVAKPLPPEIIKIKGENFMPTGLQVDNLIRSLYSDDRDEVDKMSTIDFSVAIYAKGVYRINYSRYEMGVGLSIRYLEFYIPSFETLQLPKFYTNFINSLIMERTLPDSAGTPCKVGQIASGGLILHIGPTGSGKSTAMAAELQHAANHIDGTILTFENPIEYRLMPNKATVDQCEFGVHMKAQGNMSMFETAKSNLLRKMPDVVMFGEVKTREEIHEVIDTGARGHLVLATLHAKDALEALSVMIFVMGDTRNLLARSLRAIVAHYLYLTADGRIVPLYEIFIPDETCKAKIYDNKLDDIHNRFYKERIMSKQGGQSITFSEYIDRLVEEQKLTEDDRKQLKASMMI